VELKRKGRRSSKPKKERKKNQKNQKNYKNTCRNGNLEDKGGIRGG